MSPFRIPAQATLVVGAIVLSQLCCAAPARQAVLLRTVEMAPFSQAVVTATRDTAWVDIKSTSGTGHASFELPSSRRPKHLFFRLHLRGLEDLRFSFGDSMIVVGTNARVPSMSDVREYLRPRETGGGTERRGPETQKGTEGQEISPFNANYMQVRINGVLGYPALPAGDNWLEVDAPPSFLTSSARTFEISWVDFFR